MEKRKFLDDVHDGACSIKHYRSPTRIFFIILVPGGRCIDSLLSQKGGLVVHAAVSLPRGRVFRPVLIRNLRDPAELKLQIVQK